LFPVNLENIMTRTHAYFSALVPHNGSTPDYDQVIPVIVKAETFSAEVNGFINDAKFVEFNFDNISLFEMLGRRVQFFEKGTARAEDVEWTTMRDWGNRAVAACFLHGECFPTWVGDLYLKPIFSLRGKSGSRRLSHYLVTESPDLDSGTWEGDQLPSRG